MNNSNSSTSSSGKGMTRFRWFICGLLFLATAVNYMDRQVLSLTWKDFIAPEFHWTDNDYGTITMVFSIVYAVANLFAGRFIDWMGTKKGYLWAIGVWSLGACAHALCGWATEHSLGMQSAAELVDATGIAASTIAMVSVYYFIAARIILGVGEAGNFPAAIKVTAEYFPKRDRAFATAIFNAGATIGALAAPVSIPPLARYFQNLGVGNGWEMAFIVIGALGFVWMGLWLVYYRKPAANPHVNAAELEYIEQDSNKADEAPAKSEEKKEAESAPIPLLKCFKYPQTWAVIAGKGLTDGVWWFFLFWIPAYISDVYGYASDTPTAMTLIFALYAITMLSIYGGKLPTIIMDRNPNLAPYDARMRAMLIFAIFPLFALFAQPLGSYSYWWPTIIIGMACAAHQSWSANIYSVVGDMFPKNTIATIIGIGGMAGGISSSIITKGSGMLFTYAAESNMHFMGFEGKSAGYFIVFCFCGVSYLLAWTVIKLLVPRQKPVIP